MLWRRIVYLVSVTGCFGFYIAYGEWLSWLLLMALAFLPLFSLLLSLPAMALTRARLDCPAAVLLAQQVKPEVTPECGLPCLVSWRFRVRLPHSDKPHRLKKDAAFTAEHCGCVTLELRSAWKYDYLGLFRWPLRRRETRQILVWPKPVPVEDLPSLKRYLAARRVPKPGGGFAEDYDLRLYRPGDNLRQIHWKLAAKTGKLVFREPTVPVRGKLALTMALSGTPDELDEKLGKLLYVSQTLLKQALAHELHCLTGDGVKVCAISDEAALSAAMAELLCARPASEGAAPSVHASWQYHIGGEPDAT